MSALAKYLLELGAQVSGSDIEDNKYLKDLKKLGATIFIGHKAENVPDDAIVVASTAIKDTNPEFLQAKVKGLDILHRSDLLAMIAKDFSADIKSTFIGFSGTHGKTTTSGLCTYVLEAAGCNPSFALGGMVCGLKTNAKYNIERTCLGNRFFVAELDESDGTITKYQPDISIINNLELDHIDFFKDGFEELLKTFGVYLSQLDDTKKILINIDCDGNRRLMEANKNKNFVTFGLDLTSCAGDKANQRSALRVDYLAKNIRYFQDGSEFELNYSGKTLGTIRLSIIGKHNVYNALAVVSALLEAGLDFEDIKDHFPAFTGMGRRFDLVGEVNGIKIIDDYAHHPTEIKTTLESVSCVWSHRRALPDFGELIDGDVEISDFTGAKSASSSGRLVAIFQPHRYTRFQGLWNEFLTCFDSAQLLIVLDVYSASEEPIEGVNSAVFVKEIKDKNTSRDIIHIRGNINESAKQIAPLLKSGDTVLTLGAGDITKMGKAIIEEIKEK